MMDINKTVYVPVPVDGPEKPVYGMIYTILLGGSIPIMSQYRPGGETGEWWTLGMSQATRVEEKQKCVSHFLVPKEYKKLELL